MIERLRRLGETADAGVLQIVFDDEIHHVAAGRRWFDHVSRARGRDPAEAFRDIIRRRWRGRLKPPFNHAARAAAGLDSGWYEAAAAPPG
jgi:uncharacterized ferritin-like protein (DUF455 family)